jgi:hypothetical protein
LPAPWSLTIKVIDQGTRRGGGELGTGWNDDMENSCGIKFKDDLGLSRLLLLLLDLLLLVEDLLGLPVADEEHHGGEEKDDGAPGGSVAESKGINTSGSCVKNILK